jgi:hypothetical protein
VTQKTERDAARESSADVVENASAMPAVFAGPRFDPVWLAARVSRFLVGMQRPPVARAMREFGFDQDEWDRGLALATALSAVPRVPLCRDALAELAAWRAKYFPVMRVALTREHAAVRDELFAGVDDSGDDHAAMVGAVLERLAQQVPEVHATLAKRGITAEVIEIAGVALRRNAESLAAFAASGDAVAAAEAELLGWYGEWSAMVRTVVDNRNALRILGFKVLPSGGVVDPILDESSKHVSRAGEREVEKNRRARATGALGGDKHRTSDKNRQRRPGDDTRVALNRKKIFRKKDRPKKPDETTDR